MKLVFIGGGNMAQALLAGLQNQQFLMSEITVVERDADKRNHLTQKFGVLTNGALEDATGCETIVLAVKPQQLPAVAAAIAPILDHQLIISIAAGIRVKDLSAWLNNYQTIVRAMPNTPAQIQAGISGLYAAPSVSNTQRTIANTILSAAGKTLWVGNEEKLDAVTAISGSGPAYVFYFIEALKEAACALGLSDADATELSITTFKGASLLADMRETTVQTLREQVTSKGGTTEQGLSSLADSKVKEAITLAAKKAHRRAKSLGDELGGINK
ncbi:MAG: pyrroline-5-carboxylate reductase [Methylophilaceae bacterium]